MSGFLGDSVLSTVISTRLFLHFPHSDEGELTRMRARLVNGIMLSRIAIKIGLDKFLLLGKGEDSSGGRENSTILSGALEALIGAIYIDSGFASAFTFTDNLFSGMIDEALLEPVHFDYKPRLQELAQALYKIPPVYRLTNETGPAHEKLFEVEVELAGEVRGKGTAKNKKQAEQMAAREALVLIGGLRPAPPNEPDSKEKKDGNE